MMSVVAIMGRPNVGKSTLFNRLARARVALVDPLAGLTRDLRQYEIDLRGKRITLMDSAGLDDETGENISKKMTDKALQGIEEADLILFVVDGASGILPADEMWVQSLRKHAKKILLIANKCESDKRSYSGQLDALRLGLGQPLVISAEHNLGIHDLEEEILAALPQDETAEEESEEKAIRLAIIGRPNAGKSSLINRLLGKERQLISSEAGTTRDSIELDWQWEEGSKSQKVKLYDTAGLRRRARIVERAEKLSVSSALQAVRFSNIVVLLMDVAKPFETQDLRLAELAIREGRGLVLAFNKIDLMPEIVEDEMRKATQYYLPQICGVPLLCLSAHTGQGVAKLMPQVLKAQKLWNKEIKTAELNSWLKGVVERRPPPAVRGRPFRVKYITQKSQRPPSFVIFTSSARKLSDDYKRYLVNDLKKTFSFEGTPVRIEVRSSENPYV